MRLRRRRPRARERVPLRTLDVHLDQVRKWQFSRLQPVIQCDAVLRFIRLEGNERVLDLDEHVEATHPALEKYVEGQVLEPVLANGDRPAHRTSERGQP